MGLDESDDNFGVPSRLDAQKHRLGHVFARGTERKKVYCQKCETLEKVHKKCLRCNKSFTPRCTALFVCERCQSNNKSYD